VPRLVAAARPGRLQAAAACLARANSAPNGCEIQNFIALRRAACNLCVFFQNILEKQIFTRRAYQSERTKLLAKDEEAVKKSLNLINCR
jgi:hypothetical protein